MIRSKSILCIVSAVLVPVFAAVVLSCSTVNNSGLSSGVKSSEHDYSGIYKLSNDQVCDLVITIKKENNGYTYSIGGKGVKSSGKLAVDKSDEQVYIVFNGTLRSGDNAAVEGIYFDGKIIIQNYGNSMNQYICFKKCDRKYLEFIKEE